MKCKAEKRMWFPSFAIAIRRGGCRGYRILMGLLLLVSLAVLFGPGPPAVHSATAPQTPSTSGNTPGELDTLKTYTPEQLRAALATLSDENARKLLLAAIDQLAVDASAQNPAAAPQTGVAAFMHHFEILFTQVPPRLKAVLAGATHLPAELGGFFKPLTRGEGPGRIIILLGGLIAILLASYGIERLLRGSVLRLGDQLNIPLLGNIARFGGTILTAVQTLLGIMVFTLAAVVLFLVFFDSRGLVRHLYGPILATMILGRLAMLLMDILCGPRQKELRLLPLDDAEAHYFYRSLSGVAWLLVVGLVLARWFQRIGLPSDSYLLVDIGVGTVLLLVLAWLVLQNRTRVASAIRGDGGAETQPPGWLTQQFAAVWHILALSYLLTIWLACTTRVLLFGPDLGGALIRSLLVVPIFLALDHLLRLVMPAVLDHGVEVRGTAVTDADTSPEDEPLPVQALRTKLPFVRTFGRVIIAMLLLVWLLKGFHIQVPYFSRIADRGFEILVTLVLALGAWRWLNVFVARKLAETAPAPSEEEEEEDEFAGVILDRSHTLLPMLRKFFGTVLVVMVVMIVLSSLGVDIGPLIAGAGVIGIAIGFGARKLVADVISGFFFLLDDAFRVGEYIEAGGVSGTVEATTLRNAIIRHHLGALQIVAYSDMGTVNNYMRGGLVVKMKFDLPYDTDIEKVRKIVKKVGKKMLADPEYSADFLQPIKSQGVYKVGDSVLTFRVKFTAKPGKQFVIKREAFRLIKEALEKKGIYFAVRKVIVQIPETHDGPSDVEKNSAAADRETQLAAGAAALETIVNEKKNDGK
jgi:small-conductance mechanosensitive channel